MTNKINSENNLVDFCAHKKLFRKCGKVFMWSIIWRIFLVQDFPALMIEKFCKHLEVSWFFSLGIDMVVGILITLITTPYLVQYISRISNKNFNVRLVNNGQVIEKMSYYDSLCWMGSFVWRGIISGFIIYLPIFIVLEIYAVIYPGMMDYLDRIEDVMGYIVGYAGFSLLGLYWLLRTKKKGRLILLQPKTEPASETIPTSSRTMESFMSSPSPHKTDR